MAGNLQDFSLMFVKLVRRGSTELGKVLPPEKYVNSSQAQMRKPLTIIDKIMNAL